MADQWLTNIEEFFYRCTSAFAMLSTKSKLVQTVIFITGSDIFKLMSQV